ncbi:nucleotide exchange factor GrpE [Cryobacterium sp. 1639]|uniref:nucleotide exchange factor GrpE n=1 Tax=Cryobacterium inferilacus TaxID=2866629 RepID=UPI001C738715|nr:nucleotide exchange factor GrpE [Cryobacterium sp. 1639]MBX0299233.1 nucleotide exchange factor GrpE [Cryobacterium sp. 1639]
MTDTNRPDENRPEDESAAAAGAPESGAPAAGGPDNGFDVDAELAAAVDATEASEVKQGESPDAATAEGIEEDELTVQDILDAANLEAAEPSSEHLADLKRVTAEYANYRKRTEANREVERERATGEVIKVLLPVLDDLHRAEKHGDLEGATAFATIAAKLRASTERIGLKPYGAVGDVFDPTVHEAIFQQPSADVDVETVGDVVETGYYLGSSLLRVAKVVVQVPSDG